MNMLIERQRRWGTPFAEILIGDSPWAGTFERPSFREFVDAHLGEEWPWLAQYKTIDAALNRAVVPAFRRADWERAVEAATPLDAETHEVTEWVTFVPGVDPNVGIILPEDRSPLPKLSWFERRRGRIRICSVTLTDKNAAISVSDGHCDPPIDGTCASGSCGKCVARVREIGEWGLICWCGH